MVKILHNNLSSYLGNKGGGIETRETQTRTLNVNSIADSHGQVIFQWKKQKKS